MARGAFVPGLVGGQNLLLKDAIERYIEQEVPRLRSQVNAVNNLRAIARQLGDYSLAAITPAILAGYRDERLASGAKTQTVRHDLGWIQRVYKTAVQEWGVALPAGIPTAFLRKPPPAKARDRRLQGDEETRLLTECANAKNPWLLPVVRFAIETAMRAGEMLETKGTADPETGERPIRTVGLLWAHVDLEKRTATLPITKNGTARVVPLSSVAVEILRGLPRSMDGRVFGTTYEAIHLSFTRVCKRAGIEDLRFHDLRHEATTRFFEKGLNPMEVAAITGHKTLQMLKRYTHLRAEELAKRLD
ncbi:site-specific integrase [Acidithiobacillus caldus]|jgi:integrase|uniref:site-specific integrase n=1 Tax=Acidithiobacillus caldus TaxID=33059 RepID=UPI001D0325F6|nr:site-specific integrase [Acidithiobacillus caldus]